MAGLDRPKCNKCGKWYTWSWYSEKWVPNCVCNLEVMNA